MPAIVNLDGRLVSPAEATISVFDRGFLSGDLVYEVLRTYRGRPYEVEAHLARLGRSAARIGLPLPWDPDRIAREVDRTLEAARGPDDEDPEAAPWNHGQRTVRLVMTRGVDPRRGLGLEPGPRALALVEPLRGPPVSAYREGVRCLLVHTRAARIDPQAKTGQRLAEAVAGEEARAAGAHEALLLDGRGLVTEGASSNLFVVKRGQLETPPPDAGILPGITRERVLRLAHRAGIPVVEMALEPRDLYQADEIFITSTTREVLPVTGLGEARVAGGAVGPVTAHLHQLFREAVTREAVPR